MLRYVQKRERGTRVGRVDFGLLNADEVRRMAVAEVCDLNIYQRGMPQVSGINNHRMGTVDRRLMCGTCGHDVRSCPGHTGYIALPLPCYHTGYLDQLLKVLRSVCFFCSRLTLADDEGPPRGAADAKAHFAAVYAAAWLKRRCAHCQAPRPALARTVTGLHVDWSRVDPADWASPEERAAVEAAPFTPASALSVLTDVSDADAARLGFTPCAAHPRDLVLCSVLVPPPISRPAIMASEGSRSRGQDDLTHRLQDINKRCIELRAWLAGRVDPMHGGGEWRDGARWHGGPAAQLASALQLAQAGGAPAADLLERWQRLQADVGALLSGSAARPARGGGGGMRSVALKSVADRLKGKDGRVRGNLMGKRVNFSARSVITPDPIMDVHEVGVPYGIATTLTVPERVTPANINDLHQRVLRGAGQLDGAECIITGDNGIIQLEACRERDKIRL